MSKSKVFNRSIVDTTFQVSGQDGNHWKKAFEFFVDGKRVTNVKQKKALLLHCAGMDAQGIFETPTLNNTVGVSEYEAAVKELHEHFSPKVNIPYERHFFAK